MFYLIYISIYVQNSTYRLQYNSKCGLTNLLFLHMSILILTFLTSPENKMSFTHLYIKINSKILLNSIYFHSSLCLTKFKIYSKKEESLRFTNECSLSAGDWKTKLLLYRLNSKHFLPENLSAHITRTISNGFTAMVTPKPTFPRKKSICRTTCYQKILICYIGRFVT